MKCCIVYRYIDLSDNITKYIGIVTSKSKKRCLEDRLKEHRVKDGWAFGNYRIEYFVVTTRTDAEAFESHLIAYYETYKYFNVAKSDWGLSVYLPTKINWNHYITYDGLFSQKSSRRKSEFKKEQIDLNKKYSIWLGSNGSWYTYLPDITKKSGRKLVKRKNKNDLINLLNSFYSTVGEGFI